MGFSWDEVHKINPRLIMASISAFGQTGPLSKLPGYDYIGASYAAVLDMIGEPDGPPYFYMLGIGDVMTGVHALAAINGALYYRERTGKGQYVEASLLDSYFHCHEVNVQMHTASNGEFLPRRSGAHHYAAAPAGIYKVKDGYIFLAVLQNQWPNMVKALGKPELLNDPRFADNTARVQNREALNAIIDEALSKYDTPVDAADALGFTYHVPSAPILSVAEAVKHPHLIERRTIRTVTDPVFGTYQIPGMPLRFSEFPEELPLQAEYLGQSNVDVFTKYAGRSASEIRRLEEEGALIAKPDLIRAQAAE
jgi:crotonobetainyl-CoA:carnitine CoA-transferase CaiB-like acyl-CoA transferase